jgi:ribosome-associated protein
LSSGSLIHKNDVEELISSVAQTIYDKKGYNIVVIDVKGVSSFTDYFIIAEGNIDRHVKAISRSIQETASEAGHSITHIEGMEEGDWVVLDYLDFIVHIFTPELRDRYRLEEVWKEGKVLDIAIQTEK